MRQGRHFKTAEAKKHTVGELIDRYLREIEKKNPKRFVDVKTLLGWWKGEIGVYLLSDASRALIVEQRDKLLNTGESYEEDLQIIRTPRTGALLRR